MANGHSFPYTVFDKEEQNVGLGQSVQIHKEDVYKVAEMSPRGLITTSGRIDTTTLDETSDYIIANMGGRLFDWSISLKGIVQRIVHPDDSITDIGG